MAVNVVRIAEDVLRRHGDGRRIEALLVPQQVRHRRVAREIRARVRKYVEEEGVLPRAILMEGHGLIAMGDSPKAVTNITDMAEKISHVMVGLYALGGPRFMPQKDIDRIYTRPDEKYREKTIAK